MPSLTLKNIPEALLERLRARAQGNRRSLLQECLMLLDQALAMPERGGPSRLSESTSTYGLPESGPEARDPGRTREDQVAAWRELCGEWESDVEGEDEIAAIYAARTAGREVDL